MVDLKRVAMDASVGALTGMLATVPMSALMLLAQHEGLMGTQPPRRITDEAIEATDDVVDEVAHEVHLDPPEPVRRGLTALNHLGFGATAGALFGIVAPLLPGRVPREGAGMVYALGVWASAYQGWVPALGIMPPADEDRPDRPASMIAAHLVYGAVLGAGLRVLRPRR